MSNLLLYSNITPNNANKHYLFSDIADYKAELQPYLTKSLALNNYRINANIIKVAIDETITENNYNQITYAICELNNICYIVNNTIIQSGYVILECSIDFWASYIAHANISNINVIRCNRNVDIGIYDSIKATINNVQTRFSIPQDEQVSGYPNYWKFEELSIVWCMTYNVYQSSGGAVSTTGVFAMDLQDVYDKYVTDTPQGQFEHPIEIAKSWVGGIYGVAAQGVAGLVVSAEAQVTKAYLIPSKMLAKVYQTDVKVNSRSLYGDYTPNNPITVYEVLPFITNKTFTIETNPNYNYYVGTINKGLKVVRDTSGTTEIVYRCIVTNNGVQMVVLQGDNQQDITDEFSIELTYNQGDITYLGELKATIKTILGIVGAVSAVRGGKFASGIGKAVDVGNVPEFVGEQRGNGDGVVTYRSAGNSTLGQGIVYPFGYTTCQSTSDEQVNARNKGAYYDCYVSSLASIFTHNLIGTAGTTDTYIQADVCVDGVPNDAIDVIKSKLSAGVYLVKLGT